tara:strand:- start:605 stop:796 length:192 start_codon:yes stop_codon:yes gene_type:complete
MSEINVWGLTEYLLLLFNLVALYIGFRFLFTRVRKKMRTVEEIHRNNAGSRSLFSSSLLDESE